jgi:hypothetical protein
MAQSNPAPLSSVTGDSTSLPEAVKAIGEKNTANRYNNESMEDENILEALDEAAAIPKGTIDPVYEAKARVLNHAVSFPSGRLK